MSAPLVRRLPAVSPAWERSADVVVVGSGAAGISAALAAAGHGRRVLLISKEELGGGATPLAQGGLAAAIGPGDDAGQHQRDTLAAGAGLCDAGRGGHAGRAGAGEIARLARLGARLEVSPLHLEGGHSRPRIVHAGGDAAGAEVHRTLLAALLASPVEILAGGLALDALADERGTVGGLLVGLVEADGRTLRPGIVTARAVVLATGGFGQVFATTTNPAGLTGDGLALAARAGATLRDVEFVQFHPTVFWQEAASGQCPLITEALRGAGAVLVDAAGRPVMAGVHPLGDLAPRDVVSAAMRQRMDRGDGPADHLWLDATGLGRRVETEFPTVTARCRERGIDPVTEPDPGRAGGALRVRRDPGRPGRPDERAGPAGDRGGGQHGRARGQPSGLQLADRVPDRRPARGCPSGSETAPVHGPAPGASTRCRGQPVRPGGPGLGHVRPGRGGPRPRRAAAAAGHAGPGLAGGRRADPAHGRGDQPARGVHAGHRGGAGPRGEPGLPPVGRSPPSRTTAPSTRPSTPCCAWTDRRAPCRWARSRSTPPRPEPGPRTRC